MFSTIYEALINVHIIFHPLRASFSKHYKTYRKRIYALVVEKKRRRERKYCASRRNNMRGIGQSIRQPKQRGDELDNEGGEMEDAICVYNDDLTTESDGSEPHADAWEVVRAHTWADRWSFFYWSQLPSQNIVIIDILWSVFPFLMWRGWNVPALVEVCVQRGIRRHHHRIWCTLSRLRTRRYSEWLHEWLNRLRHCGIHG